MNKQKFQKQKNLTNKVFGPTLKKSDPIRINSAIKKRIHYDCKIIGEENEEDIPQENEIYIKENLLKSKHEDISNSPDDDFSIVNINVSKLLSSSNNSNSKNNSKDNLKISNSNTFTLSPNNINKTNSSLSINNSKKIISNNSSESKNSGSNNLNKNTKMLITQKRKKIFDKLMKNEKKNNKSKDIKNEKEKEKEKEIKIDKDKEKEKEKEIKFEKENDKDKDSDIDENELKDIVQDYNFEQLKNLGENKSTNSNVKITNITNIILNVKNIPKSFDISSNNNKDFMFRDIKALNIITKRALTSNSKKNPLIDSFDNDRRSFINFKNNSQKKELYINDNSDYSDNNIKGIKDSKTEKNSQIINIININNNYSVEGKTFKNSFRIGKKNINEKFNCESYRSNKTKLIKLPVKSTFSTAKSNKNLNVVDFLKSMKSEKNIKKEKFVAIKKIEK